MILKLKSSTISLTRIPLYQYQCPNVTQFHSWRQSSREPQLSQSREGWLYFKIAFRQPFYKNPVLAIYKLNVYLWHSLSAIYWSLNLLHVPEVSHKDDCLSQCFTFSCCIKILKTTLDSTFLKLQPLIQFLMLWWPQS